MNRLKKSTKDELNRLGKFIYNRNSRKVFGRTCLSWGQIVGFYLTFIVVIGGYFAVHMGVFVAVTPSPVEDVSPWNFGKYTYPNYPNAKLGMVAMPPVIMANNTHAIIPNEYRNKYKKLLNSANQSDVSSQCLNASGNYGYDNNYPCILLHLSRVQVYSWTPDLLYQFLDITDTTPSHLNISCFTNDPIDIQNDDMVWKPNGIPLQLSNNDGPTSFPYRNQPNYTTPVVGVRLNMTAIASNTTLTRLTITCGLDLQSLSAEDLPQEQINRIYELPTNASIIVVLTN